MTWAATIGAGFLSGIAGGVGAGFLTYFTVARFGLRRGDGADLGYYLVFIPVGILCGFVIGAILSRWVPGFGAALGLSLAVVAGLCLLGAVVPWMFGEVPPELEGEQLVLQVELKYPAGWQPDREAKLPEGRYCQLLPVGPGHKAGHATRGNVIWESAGEVDGQWVAPCEVRLTSSREIRLVGVTLGKSYAEFNLGMKPTPSEKDKQWSAWITEGFSWEAGKAPVTGYAYRCRVQRVSDLRDKADAAARAFWDERDRMAAAIPADASIEQWLPLFEDPDGNPAEYRWGGMERMERKAVAAQVRELGPLLESTDRKTMRLAVVTLGSLYETPEPLVDPLIAAGRGVVEAIREARAVPANPEDGEAQRKNAERRAWQYFGLWRSAMNNAGTGARERFRGILEEIHHEAETSDLSSDLWMLARDAKESLEEIEKARAR